MVYAVDDDDGARLLVVLHRVAHVGQLLRRRRRVVSRGASSPARTRRRRGRSSHRRLRACSARGASSASRTPGSASISSRHSPNAAPQHVASSSGVRPRASARSTPSEIHRDDRPLDAAGSHPSRRGTQRLVAAASTALPRVRGAASAARAPPLRRHPTAYARGAAAASTQLSSSSPRSSGCVWMSDACSEAEPRAASWSAFDGIWRFCAGGATFTADVQSGHTCELGRWLMTLQRSARPRTWRCTNSQGVRRAAPPLFRRRRTPVRSQQARAGGVPPHVHATAAPPP